ncbi:MAG: hypothetical protein H6721_09005 [Sandaracinus sp.]|nr:hypothetical protein [Sandaracinus sp.]MCB9611405.1 hypothetical protein [Sandaracinus sp.]MCB9621756.1 hypothetical protein [Sandaracinus sp.]MCB9632255.1 hypothetical protein [Sandaracinus sp.]
MAWTDGMATRWLALGVAALALTGCPKSEPPLAEGIYGPLGSPIPTATEEQRATFERGQAVALHRFGPEDGLGPHFNVSFCAACHEKPVVGGGASRYRNFLLVGQQLPDGTRGVLGVNGVLPQFEIETSETVPTATCLDSNGLPTERTGALPGEGPTNAVATRRATDPAANHFAGRNAIPFFGVGLIAELDEASILRNADPMDEDGDGISGRPNLDRGFVGRFGVKSQTVSIEGFIRGPLFNHLGITTNPLSDAMKARLPVPSVSEVRSATGRLVAEGDVAGVSAAQAAAPDEPNFDDDDVCDPEMSEQMLFDLVSWAMLLAAPEAAPETPESAEGHRLFGELGCTSCHVESLRGPRGRLPLFSDLLIHDMGPDLADGVVMGRAGRSIVDDPEGCPESSGTGCEFRTAPLWGVSAIGPYLHDGRADTLEEAILFHGGEAQRSRDAFAALDATSQQRVVDFLVSLGGASQHSDGLLPQDAPVPAPGTYGGPQTPLMGPELERFVRGRAVFDHDFFATAGTGPTFNGDACRSCHLDPVIGGSGPRDLDVTRHGFFDGSTFSPPTMGTMAHRHALDGVERPAHDDAANVEETRQTPSILGMGLLDRIPEAAIVANEDADDTDGDGISGRAHRLADGRIGRFGWRANVPSTAEFVRDAMSNELGLTLPAQAGLTFGFETDDDGVADPEIDAAPLEDLAFFLNTIASPPRGEVNADATAGEALFASFGCTSCHATLQLDDGTPVRAFTDLLLHDVQEEGFVAVGDGDAAMNEYRTTPLWGVRDTAPYWHDGRASTLEAAVAAHAGEATEARRAHEMASAEERARLLAFLRSL